MARYSDDYDKGDAAWDDWNDVLKKQGLPKWTTEAICSECGHTSRLEYYDDSFDTPFGVHRYTPRNSVIVTHCCEAEPVLKFSDEEE